jgi:hypothetical protein
MTVFNDYGAIRSLRLTDELDNLNNLEPESDMLGSGKLKESSVQDLTQALIRPVFRNIEQEIIEQIKRHDIIVGCIAWLTSIPIMEALQGKDVQFIVQQEDWLRPDSTEWSMSRQRSLYQSLSGIDTIYAGVNYASYSEIQPIRLSGKPKTKNRSNPRMHHKFVLFAERNEQDDYGHKTNLLWTGSYNFTANATKSLENGLFVKCPEVIEAYWLEWRQVLLSSFRIEDKWWNQSYGWSSDDDCLRDGT